MKRSSRTLLYLIALIFLGIGTAFAAYVVAHAVSGIPLWTRPAESNKPVQTVAPEWAAPGGTRSTADSETRKVLDAAAALLTTGKLQEAQDRYLDVLLTLSAQNPEALNGLVQVRRRATNNKAALLRRQGEAYKAAARRGGDGAEHYTAQALWLLARASYLAIAQMEFEDQGRAPVVAQGPPTRTEQSPAVSRGAGRPDDARRSLPSTSQVEMSAPPAPPSQISPLSPATSASPSGATGTSPSPSDIEGPKLIARVGPLAESDDAERLATQIQREGFVARVATETSQSPRRYMVVSEPTSRQTADARARALATLGIKTSIVELEDGLVRLLLGTSSQPDEARSLARQIRAHGYPATVVPEGGTLYFVVIGPHGKAKTDELMGRLSTGTFPVVITPAP